MKAKIYNYMKDEINKACKIMEKNYKVPSNFLNFMSKISLEEIEELNIESRRGNIYYESRRN